MMKTQHHAIFCFLLISLLLSASGLESTISTATTTTITSSSSSSSSSRFLQSSNPRVLGDAYECDELFQPVVDDTPRPIGYEIRICIIPSIPTRQRDIVMRSIDEFSFYKNFGSAKQLVVDKGVENDQQLSIVLCVPGQLICSLKTRLKNDFFYDNDNADYANITGSGTVSFEYSNDFESDRKQRVLVQQKVELRGRRRSRSMIEQVAGGFAGTDTVRVTIPVEAVPRPKDDPLAHEDDAKGWWKTAPTWLKVLIILGAIVTAILLCCLCGLCIYSLQGRIDDEKKQQDEKNERAMEHEYHDDDDDYDEYADYTTSAEDPAFGAASQAETATAANRGDQPTDFDVCFDADDHPGTVALHNAMRYSQRQFGNEEYGPTIYRHVKQQLPGRRYFVVDDENHPDVWREAGKKELIDLFRKEYEDIQHE